MKREDQDDKLKRNGKSSKDSTQRDYGITHFTHTGAKVSVSTLSIYHEPRSTAVDSPMKTVRQGLTAESLRDTEHS